MIIIGVMVQSAIKKKQLTECEVLGSKVLRTRKIKLNNWNKNWWTKYFCGNGCFNQFVNRNLERVVAIAPRPDALETPIEDPVKTTSGYGWNNWEIKEVDND